MANVAKNILNKFQCFIDSKSVLYDHEMIEMSSLISEFRNTDRIEIPMSHPDTNEFYEGMDAAIILNLCKNPLYGEYPWHGLLSLRRIFEKDHQQDDSVKIQLQLLIHITKMNLKPTESGHYINNFEGMVEYEPSEDSSMSWLDIAKKTISNESVLSSINGLIENIFEVEINDTNKRAIGVSFVDLTETDLRGFSGFHWVYINFAHFDCKLYKQRKFPDCNVLVALDVVTLVLHEYAHVRIRQILNDINMATPAKLPRHCTIEDLEFGRIAERHFFGVAPDWLKSFNRDTVSGERLLHFAEAFISSIQTNKKVPALPLGLKLKNREGATTMGGADIEVECHIE